MYTELCEMAKKEGEWPTYKRDIKERLEKWLSNSINDASKIEDYEKRQIINLAKSCQSIRDSRGDKEKTETKNVAAPLIDTVSTNFLLKSDAWVLAIPLAIGLFLGSFLPFMPETDIWFTAILSALVASIFGMFLCCKIELRSITMAAIFLIFIWFVINFVYAPSQIHRNWAMLDAIQPVVVVLFAEFLLIKAGANYCDRRYLQGRISIGVVFLGIIVPAVTAATLALLIDFGTMDEPTLGYCLWMDGKTGFNCAVYAIYAFWFMLMIMTVVSAILRKKQREMILSWEKKCPLLHSNLEAMDEFRRHLRIYGCKLQIKERRTREVADYVPEYTQTGVKRVTTYYGYTDQYGRKISGESYTHDVPVGETKWVVGGYHLKTYYVWVETESWSDVSNGKAMVRGAFRRKINSSFEFKFRR